MANAKYKPVYQKSIEVLNSRLERLIATRDKLIDASIAGPVPAPGKNPFLCVVVCQYTVDAPLIYLVVCD